MTEIPEHLLQRSRERRSAMGLGGDDAPAPASGEAAPPAVAAAAAPAKATAPVPDVVKAPPPVPPYVAAAQTRKKMPLWAAPVVLGLPIWAAFYVGTLERPPEEAAGLLAEGEVEYASCAACHGAAGGGGSGPQLSDGEVLLTFPDIEDQILWLINGSPANGTPYGDPGRPGGQRAAAGGMPAFGTLTNRAILSVVLHERATLAGDAGSAELATLVTELVDSGEIDLSTDWDESTTREQLTEMLAPALEEPAG